MRPLSAEAQEPEAGHKDPLREFRLPKELIQGKVVT